MNRIIIAEDEPRIAAFLEKGLRANGFATTVVENGDQAINRIQNDNFDLLILDLGLPGKDGWNVLERLRGEGEELPIVILSACNELEDKVAGLNNGADDYVTKPFRFEELLARVRVQLRQKNFRKESDMVLNVGDIVLDLRSRLVQVGDRTIELSAKEFILAETFLRHPGQVMTRERLLSHVWGYDYDPGSNIVDVYVGYLRKKLGNNSIETVRGMGYRLRK